MFKISIISLLTLLSFDVMATTINTNQVQGYVGKNVTVCGKIAEITIIRNDTFINIDASHPYQKFYFYTNNQTLNNAYLNKTVCGTGTLNSHKGKYQIKIADVRSLSVK